MIDFSYGTDKNVSTSAPTFQSNNSPPSTMAMNAPPGVDPYANPSWCAERVSPTSNEILVPLFQQQQQQHQQQQQVNLYGLNNGYNHQSLQQQQKQQQQQKNHQQQNQPANSKIMGSMLVPAQQQQTTSLWALTNDGDSPPPTKYIQTTEQISYDGSQQQKKWMDDPWNDASEITIDTKMFNNMHPPPPASAPPPPPVVSVLPPHPNSSTSDFWNNMGFDSSPHNSSTPVVTITPEFSHDEIVNNIDYDNQSLKSLPPGGTYYDMRIYTPKLGIMFFRSKELKDSLFANTDQDIIDGLFDRPVAGFIVEGSSARSEGVKLGHILTQINGVDVKHPKQASRMIKDGPRPLPMRFYVLDTEVVIAEKEHMVKYDSKSTDAPHSSKEWKPKYVVIGGVLAQPWMMNMYRSKSEYDAAVIDKQTKRPISVKVKRFSLKNAQILNDWEEPQMVKYKNELNAWHYFVILPAEGKPIKISSTTLDELKAVYDGVQRALLWEQQQQLQNRHLDNSPLYDYPDNNITIAATPVAGYPDHHYNNNILAAPPAAVYPDNNNLLAAPPTAVYPDNNNLLAAPPVDVYPDNNNVLVAPSVAIYDSHDNNGAYQDWNNGFLQSDEQQQQQYNDNLGY